MEWITQKQAKEAGKKSEKAAIKCSALHWRQLAEATEGELRKKMNSLKQPYHLVCTGYCALCERHDEKGICSKCKLKEQGWSCCRKWKEAATAFNRFCVGTLSHSVFTKAAVKMAEKIEGLI